MPMAMTGNGKCRRCVATAGLAIALAGCTTSGGTSDDKIGRFLVAPDKFVLYNCDQIAEQAKATSAREQELLQLMAKAGQGADGQLVSTIAYRPEYLSMHADMNELRNAAAAKNCKFVPGVTNPPGQAGGSKPR
jgi:hypothetical protein